jgi:hypothetical protein
MFWTTDDETSNKDTEQILDSDVTKVDDVLSSLFDNEASPSGSSAVDTQGNYKKNPAY